MHPLPDRFEHAAPDLLPVVRAADRVAEHLLTEPLAPGLVVAVAWDTPELRRLLPKDVPRRWRVPAEALFLEARGNLYPEQAIVPRGQGFEVATGDGYESSRLALPGWLGAFSTRLGGTPVAFVPHARALWVCSEATAPSWAEAARLAWQREGEPISPGGWTVRDGRLVPWISAR